MYMYDVNSVNSLENKYCSNVVIILNLKHCNVASSLNTIIKIKIIIIL